MNPAIPIPIPMPIALTAYQGRAGDRDDLAWPGALMVTLIRADEPDLPGVLLRRLQGKPVYVHLDCDVLEPGLVPTDFQVPGGLSLERLATAMEALATLTIVGLEVAEFQTGWSPDEQGAATAGLLQAMHPLLNAVRNARQAPPRMS